MIKPKTLWIDLKTRQLRVAEFANTPYTSVVISHKIKVKLPNTVYFDNGSITGKLVDIDGNRLILEDYVGRLIGPGESVNIIDDTLEYLEPAFFTENDLAYIEACRKLEIRNFMISYVESRGDIQKLKALSPDCITMAKIENKKGLKNLEEITEASEFILAARGDLYTEIDYPHKISEVMKSIKKISKEKAIAASRMLGSLLRHPMPSCPDIMDIQYLKEMGYDKFLIGDDICFKREILIKAINIFKAVFA
jgi:pyruvate kinase